MHWEFVEGSLGRDLMVKDSTVLVDAEGLQMPAAAQVGAHCSIVAEWSFVSDQLDESIPHEYMYEKLQRDYLSRLFLDHSAVDALQCGRDHPIAE